MAVILPCEDFLRLQDLEDAGLGEEARKAAAEGFWVRRKRNRG
ncbi:hypothetical protein [Kyrpidia spormannii]|uniref:Uncharacterized protein n=1 Tax=Kyrpidia spormannii TaxID=2055160 RepID=A0ACA8Z726_9BACL|nr:hypothetical protein [Kyrpidia spormannii]CAB3389771.1 protein of unknown function [Kyrpidia spormannii]